MMYSVSLKGDQRMEIWINRRKSEGDGLDYSVYTWKRSDRASEIHGRPLEDSETQGDLRDLGRITTKAKVCTINVTHWKEEVVLREYIETVAEILQIWFKNLVSLYTKDAKWMDFK